MMTVTPSNMTVAELCQQIKDGTILIDHDYQRSLNWPASARSFLIDTILCGYPLPKLSLSQTTDLKTKKTLKYIVDGQQRTSAITDFLDNKFRVSTKASVYRGKNYSHLEDVDQARFLAYVVNIDLFTGATEDDVREVFRRMNWYTAPANAQEKRHSQFSGEFKQFISGLAQKYSPVLSRAGTFSKRQISRMADTEFLSECSYTYMRGIDHSSQPKLDSLYAEKDADDSFPEEARVTEAFDRAFQLVSQLQSIYDSSLTKEYNMYSLITAAMHVAKPSEALLELPTAKILPNDQILNNLTRLDQGLQKESERPEMELFASACAKATNRRTPRRVRFQYFLTALTSGDFASLSKSLVLEDAN